MFVKINVITMNHKFRRGHIIIKFTLNHNIVMILNYFYLKSSAKVQRVQKTLNLNIKHRENRKSSCSCMISDMCLLDIFMFEIYNSLKLRFSSLRDS